MRVLALVILFSVSGSAAWAQAIQSPRQLSTWESDSVLNGALIGAGVGVASGLFICTRMEPWRNCRDDVGPMLKMGAIGALVGAGIDASLRRRTFLSADLGSARVEATPVVAPGLAGFRAAVSFRPRR